MPGFYQPGEYDLAGFCVGIVEKSQMLNGSQVQVGDIAIGLASQGVHSNGFSLVRKIVSESATLSPASLSWDTRLEQFAGQSLGEVLLTPTQIYVKPVLEARRAGIEIHGMAHITGGGLPENLPRCLGIDQSIQVHPNSWSVPPIFQWLADAGQLSTDTLFNTFNMGIGFVLLVSPEQAEPTLKWFESQDIAAFKIGEVINGSGSVVGLLE
jgi:phosphoribosylformylglycinamidine cyclo-ligase